MRHRRRQAVAIAASTVNGAGGAPESKSSSQEANDIRDVYEARGKAQRLLADLEKKRDGATSILAQSFAKVLTSEQVDVDRVFTQYREWEAEDDRLGQQIDAFTDLRAMLMTRWTFFKTHYPKDVLTVLTTQVEHLGQVYSRREAEAQSLQKRIEKLTAEIETLRVVSLNVESRAGVG
jgi:hypothetical protein